MAQWCRRARRRAGATRQDAYVPSAVGSTSSTRVRALSQPPPSARSASSERSASAMSSWPMSWSTPAALRWLAAELDAHSDFTLVCWVDSVRGVELMTSTLTEAGAGPARRRVRRGRHGGRPHGLPRGGTPSTRWPARSSPSPRLRLIGVAGYEAALGHDVAPDAVAVVRSYLADVRAAVLRLAPIFECDRIIVDGGRQYVFRYRRRRAHRMARRCLRAHDPAQRVLSDARRRTLRPHIAAAATARCARHCGCGRRSYRAPSRTWRC